MTFIKKAALVTSSLVSMALSCLTSPFWHRMSLRNLRRAFIYVYALSSFAAAAPKTHLITFGKWNTVQYRSGAEDGPLTLKIRPLLVDARVKEFTVGPIHDVTDRLFVVQRVFRINDSLPDDPVPHWQWQLGGWLLVDRVTAHVSVLNLPEFDALFSTPSWYRDYAAYCGLSDDGRKIFAVVAEIGRRKPILKKLLVENDSNKKEEADAQPCAMPAWERSPARVTFSSVGTARQTFAIRGHTVDLVMESQDDEEDAAK